MEFIEILINLEEKLKRKEGNLTLAKNYEKKEEFFNALLCRLSLKSILSDSPLITENSYRLGKICQKISKMSGEEIFASFDFLKIKDLIQIDEKLFEYKSYDDKILFQYIERSIKILIDYAKENNFNHFIFSGPRGHLMALETLNQEAISFNKNNLDRKMLPLSEFESPQTQLELAQFSYDEGRYFDAIFWYKKFIINPESSKESIKKARTNLASSELQAESKSEKEINEFYDEYIDLLKDKDDEDSAKKISEALLQKLEIMVRRSKPKNIIFKPSTEELGELNEITL